MAVGDILVRVGADVSQYTRALQTAGTATMSFGNVVTGIGGGIAAVMTGIAITSAAGLAGVLSVASEYESAFTDVRKVLEGTDAEFDALSAGIRQLAREIPLTTS